MRHLCKQTSHLVEFSRDMFVPSLSWQMIVCHQTKWRMKKEIVSHRVSGLLLDHRFEEL